MFQSALGDGGPNGPFMALEDAMAAAGGSGSRMFSPGDRVRVVEEKPTQQRVLRSLRRRPSLRNTLLKKDKAKTKTKKKSGPPEGATGRVVLTFDDNPRKIGVEFDEPIPNGISLGNLCKDGHGFFVEVNLLLPENESLANPNILFVYRLLLSFL